MRVFWFSILLFLFATLGAAALFAQSLEQILDRSNYSEAEREAVREVFGRAESYSIPDRMLTPRLAEGIAKGVPAQRLIAVLSQDVERIRRARELLEEAAPDSELSASSGAWSRTATLLAAGVPVSVLERLAEAAEQEPSAYRPATELYVSLTDWGLAAELAGELCASVVRSSVPPDQYPVVVEILTEARRSRMNPESVAEELVELFPESSSVRSIRRQLGL